MRLHELARALSAEILFEADDPELVAGYTSDLLSDVLAHAPPESVLITIQAHRNTVAVATVAGIRAILLAHARPVPNDMLEAARQHGIALLRSPDNQFVLSYRIYQLLHRT